MMIWTHYHNRTLLVKLKFDCFIVLFKFIYFQMALRNIYDEFEKHYDIQNIRVLQKYTSITKAGVHSSLQQYFLN